MKPPRPRVEPSRIWPRVRRRCHDHARQKLVVNGGCRPLPTTRDHRRRATCIAAGRRSTAASACLQMVGRYTARPTRRLCSGWTARRRLAGFLWPAAAWRIDLEPRRSHLLDAVLLRPCSTRVQSRLERSALRPGLSIRAVEAFRLDVAPAGPLAGLESVEPFRDAVDRHDANRRLLSNQSSVDGVGLPVDLPLECNPPALDRRHVYLPAGPPELVRASRRIPGGSELHALRLPGRLAGPSAHQCRDLAARPALLWRGHRPGPR